MRRFVSFLVFVPLGLALLLLAIANRTPTLLSLDPLNPSEPLLSVKLPMFVYLFIALILGVVLGGVSTWLSQRRFRKDARRFRREAAAMKSDMARAEMNRAKQGPSGDGGGASNASGLPAIAAPR